MINFSTFKINSIKAGVVQNLLTCRLFIIVMYRYFDPKEDSFLNNDNTYQRILEQLKPITSNLKSEEEKQLMLKMISNCYHRLHNSIRTKSKSDTGLLLSTIMSLLLEQSIEIERLSIIRNQ